VNIDSYTYNLRGELRSRLRPWLSLRLGLDLEGTHALADVRAPQPGREGDPGGMGTVISPGPNTAAFFTDRGTFDYLTIAPFAELRLALFGGRLELATGLRLDSYTVSAYRNTPDARVRSDFLPEPRVGARFTPDAARRWTLKAGAGLFHQPPQPAELSRTFGNPALAVSAPITCSASSASWGGTWSSTCRPSTRTSTG
jgi:hypothetical protein